ncbi:MAG: cell envelope integrity EipB family protein [Bauldia sp.]|nr:cell envelope integrity EipB family protein [Bauldia sp.]MCB1504016.1 cell envelope integrity EipB family protein [Hyphomicrobiaceae bacterium]
MRQHGVRRLGALIATIAVAGSADARATAPTEMVRFAPHRAVYEITLERAASGSGVVELAGRMVYELQGSRCEGYTQNMRFVTQVMSQDGTEQLNDLRTSSWEDGAGKRLRFNSEQYRDRKLAESTTGDARRPADGGDTVVQVAKPEKQSLTIPARYLFPMQQSEALVRAARGGERQLAVGIYDGSEKGTKAYETSAWIGGPRSELQPKDPKSLTGITSWPVSIAYFEPAQAAKDSVPSYELSFRIFANGVSTDMVIDYGEFAVRGELKELTFLSQSSCEAGTSSAAGAKPGPKGK